MTAEKLQYGEGIPVKLFLQKLKTWETACFINSDVWSDMKDIVESEAINRVIYHTMMRLLSCVAQYVVISNGLYLTVDMLRLPANRYRIAETDHGDDKHLIHFIVSLLRRYKSNSKFQYLNDNPFTM